MTLRTSTFSVILATSLLRPLLRKCIAKHKSNTSIRELAFPTTKASLVHTWTSDTRDDLWMATSGRLLKATHVSEGLQSS